MPICNEWNRGLKHDLMRKQADFHAVFNYEMFEKPSKIGIADEWNESFRSTNRPTFALARY